MKLSQGYFYGKTLYRRDLAGFTLTECDYAPSQRIPEHCHAASYLSVLLDGSYTEIKRRSEVACTAGTALFHPAEESHCDNFGRVGGHLFSIELAPNWLERLREEHTPTDEGYVVGRQICGLALRLAVVARQNTFNRLYAEGLVLEILGLLPRTRNLAHERCEPNWLKAIEANLREAAPQSVVLRKLCEDHGVHPSHVGRTFKRYRGCSMSAYILQLRLGQARAHLLQSHKRITEIAALLGFADHSHFSRLFKREIGMSPKEFRRIGRSERSRTQRTFY